ncbi:MAG: hypothetical protein K2N91_02840, partial [Muribaculaceae bacterium]|nr:hypothetical protein [Muribaculaceae bacterium]
EGEAPISVDENGNITTIKPGQAFVKVELSEEDAKLYNVEPVTYEVNVTAPASLDFENGVNSIIIPNGTVNANLPALELKGADGNVISDVTYTYEVVDAAGNPIESAVITVNDDGTVTANAPGQAFVKIALSEEDAKLYNVDPVICEVNVTTEATLEFENGQDKDSANIANGTDNAVVPTPVLKNENGDKIADAKYVYTVVDAQGNPFAEGEAPISVNENGEITTIKPGQAFVKVELAEEDAKVYDADPVLYEVNVTAGASIELENGGEGLVILNGTENTRIPTPELKGEDGNVISDVKFIYEVVDAEGNVVTDASVSVNENGFITTNMPGQAFVRVSLSDEDAKLYSAEPVVVPVMVTIPSQLVVDGNNEASVEISISSTESNAVPAPSLVDAEGNPINSEVALTYKYEVVDAEGNPFAEGSAPISVDENGNITLNEGAEGVALVKVTLTGEAADIYGATPFTYAVNITGSAGIFGTSDETSYSIQVGKDKSMAMPQLVFKAPEVKDDATFNYEIVEGNDIISIAADGTITGLNAGTARIKATVAGDYANSYNVEPFYINVSVRNYVYLKFKHIDDPATLNATDQVVFISSKPINGLGFVTGHSDTNLTGTTGNMQPIAILPGLTTLPDVAEIPVDEAAPIRQFFVNGPANGNEGYTFRIASGSYGLGLYIKTERADRIRYTNVPFTYSLEKNGEGYNIIGGNLFLGFNPTGFFTNGNNQTINENGANVAFYQVIRAKAELVVNDSDKNSFIVKDGDNVTIPAPELTSTGSDGQPVVVENTVFKYEVVDAEGNPFPEGEAPISVDENGNITVIKPGQAQVKVTPEGDFDMLYDAEPVFYEVSVPASSTLEFENGENTDNGNVVNGATDAKVPTPVLKDEEGQPVADVKYVYSVVDAEGNPFAEGEAPIAVDENGNITTIKPGQAFVKVELSEEDAKLYNVEPVTYEVNVTSPAKLEFEDGVDSINILNGTENTNVPAPQLKGEDGNAISGVKFIYEVVDAEGNPVEDAAISVNEDGTITTNKPGQAFVKVSLSDEDAKLYGVDPIICEVNVTSPAKLEFEDGDNDINVPDGTQNLSVPTIELKDAEGQPISDVKYVYEVVDAEGNAFPEGEAPISVDENGNITTNKPGQAFVKISLSEEDAKLYDVEPITYEVNVTAHAKLVFENGQPNANIV